MASPSKNTSRLLDLPPELRNEVYKHALVDAAPVPVPNPDGKFSRPSLLHVCRQIQSEASPIYFGANTFQADYDVSAGKFLRTLNKTQLSMIRCLRAVTEEEAREHKRGGAAFRWMYWAPFAFNNMSIASRGRIKPGIILYALCVNGEDKVVWVCSERVKNFHTPYKRGTVDIIREKELHENL